MRRQSRNGTFETNSSSVHSLVIDNSGREPSKLTLNEDNKVIAYLGSFGKDYMLYSTQEEKLSYLLTLCKYSSSGWNLASIYEDYNFKYIEDAIVSYIPNCMGIEIYGDIDDGEIDHQSIPQYGEIDIVNVYDEDSVINFVFNKYVKLKTDCD